MRNFDRFSMFLYLRNFFVGIQPRFRGQHIRILPDQIYRTENKPLQKRQEKLEKQVSKVANFSKKIAYLYFFRKVSNFGDLFLEFFLTFLKRIFFKSIYMIMEDTNMLSRNQGWIPTKKFLRYKNIENRPKFLVKTNSV